MGNRYGKNHRGRPASGRKSWMPQRCGPAVNAEASGSLWRAAAVAVLSLLLSLVVSFPGAYSSAAICEEAQILSAADASVQCHAEYVSLSDQSVHDGIAGERAHGDGAPSLSVLANADGFQELSAAASPLSLGRGLHSLTGAECIFLSDVAPPAQPQRTPNDHVDCSTAGSSDTMMAPGQTSLRPDWSGLARDSAYFVGLQVLMVGLLYLLPESVTTWSNKQKDEYDLQRWVDNVTNPVWDEDNWYLNYLVHPYWGATYYVRGRERGLSKFDSFLFSVFLSTVYEFGVEALFEPPSYQDLIITPLAGSLLGLYFEKVRDDIKAKGDRQRWYDKAALILTDPIGVASNFIDRLLGIRSSLEIRNGTPPSQRCAPSPRDAAMPHETAARVRCQGSYTGVSLKLQW